MEKKNVEHLKEKKKTMNMIEDLTIETDKKSEIFEQILRTAGSQNQQEGKMSQQDCMNKENWFPSGKKK